MRDMILHPGWRPDDFTRLRDDSLNALKISLRGNNDEELGKEVLYAGSSRGTLTRQKTSGPSPR